MKKLFFLSAMIGLMASTAAAIEIYSCNTVGVQRVTGTLSKVVAPVPFCAIGGGDVALSDTVYVDARETSDIVQVMDSSPTGFYSQWMMLVGITGVSSVFYPSTRVEPYGLGNTVTISPGAASSTTLQRGLGVTVERSNIGSPVYIMGEYDPKPVKTSIAPVTDSYLTNPTSSDFNPNEKLTSETAGVQRSDRLYVIGSDGTETEYLFNKSGKEGKHWFTQVLVEGSKDMESRYDEIVIKPGQSFRFSHRGSGVVTISW